MWEDLLPGERARAERAFAEALEAWPALRGDGMADVRLAHWRGANEPERALRAAWGAAAAAEARFTCAQAAPARLPPDAGDQARLRRALEQAAVGLARPGPVEQAHAAAFAAEACRAAGRPDMGPARLPLFRPREPREPARGANAFRLPPTHCDAVRPSFQLRGSPADSLRSGQTGRS